MGHSDRDAPLPRPGNKADAVRRSVAALLALLFGCRVVDPAQWPEPPRTGFLAGVALEGGPLALDPADLDVLARCGVNTIVLTPFASMEDPRAARIQWQTPPRGFWIETEVGIASLARSARERGIAAWLKPHLWIDQGWAGAVRMSSERDWERWFAHYRSFLLHWADFAAREGLDGLCIGTEVDASVGHEREWRALIAETRRHFSGPLTYAANWTDFERIPFWDALDFVGVNAYFPLSTAASPGVEELLAAWKPIASRLEILARHHQRPVLFTEIGYHPVEHAFVRPFDWTVGDAALDLDAQARGYEAVARVFYDQPWFAGVLWWRWRLPSMQPGAETASRRRPPRARTSTYSPQGLPAEDVLRATFIGQARAERPR